MVNHNTKVGCPNCDHEFKIKDVAIWHVCLTCGQIWPPGDDWNCHYTDDSVDCDGVHSVMKYSEDDAKETQHKVRNEDA